MNMTAALLEPLQQDFIDDVAKTLTWRPVMLFRHFLPTGYRMVELSNVNPRYRGTAMSAKLALGCLITALDDFADDPERFDAALLDQLYLAADPQFPTFQRSTISDLVRALAETFWTSVSSLPGFSANQYIIKFDYSQILTANRFHQALTTVPSMANSQEMRLFGGYNMGMVAAHMIDLMTKATLNPCLGHDRQVFLLGQRYGRLCNMLATKTREQQVGDVTSELGQLKGVTTGLLKREMRAIETRILCEPRASFEVGRYVESLRQFRQLHRSLTGTI